MQPDRRPQRWPGAARDGDVDRSRDRVDQPVAGERRFQA
jgi:hypothetical protein